MKGKMHKIRKRWNPFIRYAKQMGFTGYMKIDENLVARLLENQANFEKKDKNEH